MWVVVGTVIDVDNSLLDFSDNLSDFEGILMPTSTYLMAAAMELGIGSGVKMKVKWWCWFMKQKKKKTDPPKRYEMSICSFGDAIPAILFNANTLSSSLEIPDDTNEQWTVTVAISRYSNYF